jgi:hypothetical protein
MNYLLNDKLGKRGIMNLRVEVAIVALGLLCMLPNAGAQSGAGEDKPGNRKGQVVGSGVQNDSTVGSQNAVGADKQDAVPPKVNDKVEQFKKDAQTYLDQQQAIKKKLQGASDTERAALREQLRILREKWLEQSRELRQLYKERRSELEDKLKDHRELFDELRNAARQKAGEHRRRGGE